MTFIVQFDVFSMIFVLIFPFWVALSICIALALGKRFETFAVGSYVDKTVRRNNKLIKENRELRKELGE